MSELSPFQKATQLKALGDGRFKLTVPEGWEQGRGAYGGLVLGALARAAESIATQPEQRLRILTGDILAPVLPGPAQVRVELLRQGANQLNVATRLVQDDEVRATASVVLSLRRKAEVENFSPSAPTLPAASEVKKLPVAPPLWPNFATHFDYRCTGPLPYSGSAQPVSEGWIREDQAPSTVDAAQVVGYLDAWWPALFSTQDTFRITATVSFMAQLLVDPTTLDPSEHLRFTGKVAALQEGFFVEYRTLWSGEALVAMNQQTFVVIR